MSNVLSFQFRRQMFNDAHAYVLRQHGHVGYGIIKHHFISGYLACQAQMRSQAEVIKMELEEYTKAYNRECERNDAIKKDLEYWAQKAADPLKFKQYVHTRLDKIGIPSDPEPENNAAHGCRIEGRLNVVEKLLGNNVA